MLSGGFLDHQILDDLTLDDPYIRSHCAFLGAGGTVFFDDSRNMMKAAHDAMAFLAHESCGKCFPCRIGTQQLTERLNDDSKTGPRSMDRRSERHQRGNESNIGLWTWNGCTPRHGITNEVFSRAV